MKFNPTLPSILVAFNKPSKEQDIALIRKFYSGSITELVGVWKGVKENSYQLEEKLVCKTRLLMALNSTEQESYISIKSGLVIMNTFDGFKFIGKFAGRLKQVPDATDKCTYCPLSRTYWEATL